MTAASESKLMNKKEKPIYVCKSTGVICCECSLTGCEHKASLEEWNKWHPENQIRVTNSYPI